MKSRELGSSNFEHRRRSKKALKIGTSIFYRGGRESNVMLFSLKKNNKKNFRDAGLLNMVKRKKESLITKIPM